MISSAVERLTYGWAKLQQNGRSYNHYSNISHLYEFSLKTILTCELCWCLIMNIFLWEMYLIFFSVILNHTTRWYPSLNENLLVTAKQNMWIVWMRLTVETCVYNFLWGNIHRCLPSMPSINIQIQYVWSSFNLEKKCFMFDVPLARNAQDICHSYIEITAISPKGWWIMSRSMTEGDGYVTSHPSGQKLANVHEQITGSLSTYQPWTCSI